MVDDETTQVSYAGNGVTVAFAVTFQFFVDEDLTVYDRTDATGEQTTLALTTNYTVSGGEGSTGTVTLLVATAVGHTLIIERNSVLDQASDYQNQTSIDAEALEHDFDRATLRDQELRRETSRALRFPPGDDESIDATLPTAEERASNLLGFDTDGEPIAVVPVTLGPGVILVSPYTETLLAANSQDAWRALLAYVKNQSGTVARVMQGPISSRPASVDFEPGLYFATRSGRIYQDDLGDPWTEMGIRQEAYADLPAHVPVEGVGALVLDTNNLVIKRSTGAAYQDIRQPFPRGAIGGLQLAYDTVATITIGTGNCRTGTAADPDLQNAYHTTAWTKDLTTAGGWVAGNTGRGRPAGVALTANTWYHCFLIQKPDGTVDFGFDTSITASNLLADATIAAAGYTRYRRLGSLRTNGSSQITAFVQVVDEFRWTSPPAIVDSGAAAARNGADQSLTLTHAPTGFVKRVQLRARIEFTGGGNIVLIGGSFETIGASPTVDGAAGSPMGQFRYSAAEPFLEDRGNLDLLLGATNAVVYRASGAATMILTTQVIGWTDPRGAEL